jgi:hypothetical protein
MITSLQAPLALVGAQASSRGGARGAARSSMKWERRSLRRSRALRPALAAWSTDAGPRAREVLRAFQRTGGLVSGHELTFLMRGRTSQPISMLARWIVERRVVSFEWHGETLLPMFQFDRADMSVHRDVAAILDELEGTFDDWGLATWFALPNAWLKDRSPVDLLPLDPNAVRHAARADRFIARG